MILWGNCNHQSYVRHKVLVFVNLKRKILKRLKSLSRRESCSEISRDELLQLLPHLDRQNHSVSHVFAYKVLLAVRRGTRVTFPRSSSRNNSPLTRFRRQTSRWVRLVFWVQKRSYYSTKGSFFIRVIPVMTLRRTSSCQWQKQPLLVDVTLTVVVAVAAASMNHLDYKTCKYGYWV